MRRKMINRFKSMKKINSRWLIILLPVILLGIFFFMMTIHNVYTETYDIERFNRAKETIRSPITIENEVETQRKVRETIQSVHDRYTISAEVTEERINYVEEIFEAITKLELELEEIEQAELEEAAQNYQSTHVTIQEKVQMLVQVLSPNIVDSVNENILAQLIEQPEDVRETGKEIFIAALTDTLENGVRTENLQSARSDVKQSIRYTNLAENFKNALISLSDFAVVENSFFDPDKTSEARREAANSVEPVMIRAGEIIVREGQTITNEVYEELKLVGLLDKERNLFPVIGLILLLILTLSILTHEMNRLAKRNQLDKGKVISILLISVLTVSVMKLVSIYTTHDNQLFFAVPVATGALLVKLLIHERFGIVISALYAILGSVIFNGEIPGALNVEAGIYFFFSQLAAIIFLRTIRDRLAIVRSGIGMIIVNMLTVLLFVFLSFEKYALGDVFLLLGFGIISAFLSAVLTIGLLPFFETSLGILSDIKLLALSSPNHPLLRKLLIEAPGTYHHSIMVANLSETACEAIGANGLLARVGAYYHDLGKTLRPHYFIENQLSIRNPHDFLEPRESAEIIIQHPYDGADLLKKYRMPKEIIDIAKQHHGTSLLKYFYYKQKEKHEHVEEADFRYPGPKPQTKEAAIICICDSVEAAVRSLKEPTEEKIEEIVSSIINDRLLDGQLDESPVTLNDLKNIRTAICESLKGIFHSRIQYPTKEAK